MKFIKIFFVSSLFSGIAYFISVFALINSPIPSEYWVGEMIAIKKNLVKEHSGFKKIVIAGGSSTLFGIDAEYASRELNMPVINFGLHAGLRLEKILKEVGAVVESGDLLILPLEPGYYDCHDKPNSWQVDNIIGWDHDAWKEMKYAEKAQFLTLISPSTFVQMIISSTQKKYFPSKVGSRLNSLDTSLVLEKFIGRKTPTVFEYSAYHLDNYGDMLKTEGAKYRGNGYEARKPDHVCNRSKNIIVNFIGEMKQKGISVFFANTPYMASNSALEEVRMSELSFKTDFDPIGCFIDKREDLIFERKYYYNTSLHLNNDGRAVRTNIFINSMRNNVFSGRCRSTLI